MTTEVKKIKDEVLARVKGNKTAINRMALAFNKTGRTIERYVEDNDVILTTDVAMGIISDVLGIPQAELLTEA